MLEKLQTNNNNTLTSAPKILTRQEEIVEFNRLLSDLETDISSLFLSKRKGNYEGNKYQDLSSDEKFTEAEKDITKRFIKLADLIGEDREAVMLSEKFEELKRGISARFPEGYERLMSALEEDEVVEK